MPSPALLRVVQRLPDTTSADMELQRVWAGVGLPLTKEDGGNSIRITTSGPKGTGPNGTRSEWHSLKAVIPARTHCCPECFRSHREKAGHESFVIAANHPLLVIPAQAGIQSRLAVGTAFPCISRPKRGAREIAKSHVSLDSRLRGNDDMSGPWRTGRFELAAQREVRKAKRDNY